MTGVSITREGVTLSIESSETPAIPLSDRLLESSDMAVRCEQLLEPEGSWRSLVSDGKLLRCAWCGANADRTKRSFFTGVKSITAHARKMHSAARGPGIEKTIIASGVWLTEEQRKAYDNGKDGDVQGQYQATLGASMLPCPPRLHV